MSDRFAAHLPPAIRNMPARTRRLTIGAAAAITIGAAVAIPALLTAAARPGIAVLTGHSGPVFSVAFSPDGKILAGAGNTSMRLWDRATRRPIGHRLTGSTGGVISAAFSPDGKTLAGGGGAQGVRLWDVGTGHQIRNHLTGHTGPVGSVAIRRAGHSSDPVAADGTSFVAPAKARRSPRGTEARRDHMPTARPDQRQHLRPALCGRGGSQVRAGATTTITKACRRQGDD